MTAKPPLSAQELCQSVRACASFDASRLDRVLAVDEARGLVEVQSSASWKSLAARLRPGDGRAQEVRTAHPTIGESLACNAAGPDGRPTVSHVQSLTMVTPDGHLRRVDRMTNPDLFALVVGGHGLFGAIYSVTLRIESLARALAEAQAPDAHLDRPGEPRPHAARKLVLLVPPVRLEALVAACRDCCAEWRFDLESLAVRRVRADDETFLRLPGQEYCEVSLGLAEGANLGAQVRSTQLKRSLIDLAIAHGGGFPISCTPEATREQTEACYPQLAEFLAEQRRIDPHERWVNAWLRHQRSLLAREACEVRWGS
ncbi:MAG TPA: FAD-binding protein [Burkholderiales bacterium]|jgi:FAD/FMN-containing dehydrogenase